MTLRWMRDFLAFTKKVLKSFFPRFFRSRPTRGNFAEDQPDAENIPIRVPDGRPHLKNSFFGTILSDQERPPSQRDGSTFMQHSADWILERLTRRFVHESKNFF